MSSIPTYIVEKKLEKNLEKLDDLEVPLLFQLIFLKMNYLI